MVINDKALYIRERIVERNIESCRDITPEQMEIITILSMEHDHYESIRKNEPVKRVVGKAFSPLLTIELQNETAAPKVFYEGEEIHLKTNITFDWETDTDTHGGLSYAIEHYVKDKGYPVTNRIERRVKSHAI